MIFFYLTPLFIAVNNFYVYEYCKWINVLTMLPAKIRKAMKITIAILWGLFAVSIYIAFIMPSGLSRETTPFLYHLRRILKLIGNYNLGVLIYIGLSFAVLLLGRLLEAILFRIEGLNWREIYNRIYSVRRAILGLVNLIFIVCITLYGVHHAGDIKVNPYEISIEKSVNITPGREANTTATATTATTGTTSATTTDLKLVLLADLHLGYNIGCRQIEKMVSLVNDQDADIIIIAGDIFDNEYEAVDDPDRICELLSSMKSRYGTYAVYGNHDVDERIIGGFTFNHKDPGKSSDPRMDALLQKAGVTLLSDEYVLIDDSIYIYGRPDYSKPGNGSLTRKSPAEVTATLDKSKPVIVIDHEPYELQELADAGVDLDLCGHTHDGQFFPMNLTSRYITWENSAGLIKKDNMYNIVTSGVGLFGPNFRIGTQAEICPVTIHFDN